MASIKQQIRTNQALQVIQHSNDGMSIVEACEEVGIARSTFYYFINTHPDAIATFQEMQMVAALEQFALILANQVAILERVIQRLSYRQASVTGLLDGFIEQTT